MQVYASEKRTAVVFHGSGAAVAYHAGALRSIDEAGVRVDVVVGSGSGVVAAAFAAVGAGSALHADSGLISLWRDEPPARLRAGLRALRAIAIAGFAGLLLPAALAVIAGLLLPVWLLIDFARPGWLAEAARFALAFAPGLRAFFMVCLAVPAFAAALLVVFRLARRFARRRRDPRDALESVFTTEHLVDALKKQLWSAVRGADLSGRRPADAELGERYAAHLDENLGQPGYREVVLRVCDLESGRPLRVTLVRGAALRDAVDAREPDGRALLVEALAASAALAPFLAPRRVSLKPPGRQAGVVRRVVESSLVGGAGLAEAIAAGAEQIILVTATPEEPQPPPDRIGFRALADAVSAASERAALERELGETERLNRLIETVAPLAAGGRRQWTDPSTGRVLRPVPVFVVRPPRAALRPLDFPFAVEPGVETMTSLVDWMEQGRQDALAQFLAPHFGAEPVGTARPPRSLGLAL